MIASPIFITGIGTGIGKTVVSAIIAEALQADYWKPIQAGGTVEETDAAIAKKLITNSETTIHSSAFHLKLAASPHIAARDEELHITVDYMVQSLPKTNNKYLIIEGAGGLMVPLNEQEFIFDLILKLKAKVILVSKNYLGSINHSLLTASVCKEKKIDVLGWVFNDSFMNYEDEIVQWSGYKNLASIPQTDIINKFFILEQALQLKHTLASIEI